MATKKEKKTTTGAREKDKARKWTDARLQTITNRINEIYAPIPDELREEWQEYMESEADVLFSLHEAYENAPTPVEKAEALLIYQEALRRYTTQSRRYKEMIDDLNYRLANTRQIATDYLNGELPSIYYQNYRQPFYDVSQSTLHISEPGLATSYSIRNEQMLRELALMPRYQVNERQTIRWNSRNLNSALTQGILKGESIPEIADRIQNVSNLNRSAAVRTARTMVTNAENRGRQRGYEELSEQGVVMNKVWIATPDSRTREWHLDMDGQEVGIKDYFIDGLGNELEYPGDSSAPPETVYNCRCTTRSEILGFRRKDGSIEPMKRYEHNGLHQSQIAQERSEREEERRRRESEE